MLQTVEAEIDVNGNIRLLEPLPVLAPRRVLVTLLESDAPTMNGGRADALPTSLPNQAAMEIRRQQQMEWMKANAEEYGGQYVALIGEQLIGVGKTFRAVNEAARMAGQQNAFVTYLPKPGEVLEMGGWL